MSEISKIERLTDADRACADPGMGCGPTRVRRFIGIIDRLTAALEAAERQRDEWQAKFAAEYEDHDQRLADSAHYRDGWLAEKSRSEALAARTAELEADHKKQVDRADFFQAEHRKALDETFNVIRARDAAESELARMRERVNTAVVALNQFGGTHRGAKVALEALRDPR